MLTSRTIHWSKTSNRYDTSHGKDGTVCGKTGLWAKKHTLKRYSLERSTVCSRNVDVN